MLYYYQDLDQAQYSGDYRVDALLEERTPWNYLVPYRDTLYYTFDVSKGSWIEESVTSPLTRFNADQQMAVRAIFAHISSLTGINFSEVTASGQADFHFGATNLSGSSTIGLNGKYWSYAYQDETIVELEADTYVLLDNVDFLAETQHPAPGSEGYEVLLHEIGHGIGLGHPFEGPFVLPIAEDNTGNTVMSYTQAGDYKTTFQAFDLLALDWIYGGDGLAGMWGDNSVNGNRLVLPEPEVEGEDEEDEPVHEAPPTLGGVLRGTPGDDVLVGTAGDDVIDAGEGNDLIDPVSGQDLVDGGPGVDTLWLSTTFDKVLSHADLLRFGDGEVSRVGSDLGVVSLTGVERLLLDDALFAFDTLGPDSISPEGGKVWQVVALYQAGFGIMPDQETMSAWTAIADETGSMSELGNLFIDVYAPGIAADALIDHLHLQIYGSPTPPTLMSELLSQIGALRQFPSLGDVFSAAAMVEENQAVLVGMTGSVQELDMAFFG